MSAHWALLPGYRSPSPSVGTGTGTAGGWVPYPQRPVGSAPSHHGEPMVGAPSAQALLMSLSRALLLGCTRSVTTAPLTLATMICPTSS